MALMDDLWARRLGEPYPMDAAGSPDEWFGDRLSLELANVRRLAHRLIADLQRGRSGFLWLQCDDIEIRALISDYIFQCVSTIETNLIEAKLHQISFEEEAHKASELMAGTASLIDGKIVAKVPRPRSALDHLPDRLATLHLAGFFRAIGSCLDCLGSAVIGILALPVNLLRGGFSSAQAAIDKHEVRWLPGLKTTLDEVIAAQGPPGWLDWALDYRNMLVHRGRRLQINESIVSSRLYGPDGSPLLRTRIRTLLAYDPDASDIEVFRSLANGRSPVLGEEAIDTLRGTLKGTQTLCGVMAEQLYKAIERRADNPEKVQQPTRQQWQEQRARTAQAFDGFTPGAVHFSPKELIGHDVVFLRLVAAGIAR